MQHCGSFCSWPASRTWPKEMWIYPAAFVQTTEATVRTFFPISKSVTLWGNSSLTHDLMCNFSLSWGYWHTCYSKLSKCTAQRSNGQYIIWDTCSYTTVTQCLANALEMHCTACASFSEYMKVKQNMNPQHEDSCCGLTFLSPREEIQRHAHQRHFFKNSRLWESRKFKYNSMIYASSVNVSRDVNMNNSMARSCWQM